MAKKETRLSRTPDNTGIYASHPAIWAFLIAISGILCLGSGLYYTGGRWLAPLDDVYIVLAYGKELLHGNPCRFNAGDPVSSGATSLLYTALVAPLTAFGKSEAAPVIGLAIINAGLFFWACRLACSLSFSMMPPSMARWAPIAVIVNGPVIFGVFCGLDTALMIALTLLLWRAWAQLLHSSGESGWRLAASSAILLAITRPEGAVLALLTGLAAAAWFYRQNMARRAVLALVTGTGALLSSLMPSLLVAGSILPSSGWAKIEWFSHVTPAANALSNSLAFIISSLKGIWMGVYPLEAAVGAAGTVQAGNEAAYYFPPGALILAILGVLPLGWRAVTAPLGGMLWLAGWLLVSIILPVGWHHHRYLVPFFPVFILLSFSGMARLGALMRDPWKRQLPALLAAAWLAFSLPGLIRHIQLYGRGAGGYFWHHRLMAERLEIMRDSGSVAASDVGIMKYFTSRKIIDLKALTSPWLAPAASRGWGSIYDCFKKMGPDERPRWAALHTGRPDVDAETPKRAGIFRPFLILHHPQIRSEFALYECDWGVPGRAPSIPGWEVVDELDCGDPDSESKHGYAVRMGSPEGVPFSTIQVRSDSATAETVGDGGWVIAYGEDFIINATPGMPLVLQMRTFAPVAAYLEVYLGRELVSEVPIARTAERFQTIVIAQVPGEIVGKDNRIEVRCRRPESQHYSSFHYWAFQPHRGK